MPTPLSTPRRLFTRLRIRPVLLIAVWAAGTVAFVLAAQAAHLRLPNVDAVSYVSIAEQYAQGHLPEALNAYWSPMISWTIVPFIWSGVDSILAMMLVNAIASSVSTAIGTYFIWRRTRGSMIATGVFLIVALALALGTIISTSPDTLVVAWMVVTVTYLIWVDDRFYRATMRQRILYGAALGVLGAIGYVTKLFLLPWFVAMVVLWGLLHVIVRRLHKERSTTRRDRLVPWMIPLAALAAMVIVMAPWVTALSVKYGTFMVGSSFTVNVSEKFVPDASVRNDGVEENSLILESPPNEYAIAYIEDPTYGVKSQEEAADSSKSTLFERVRYYLGERVRAFPLYLDKLGSVAPFAFPVMVLIALAMLFGRVAYRSYPSVTIITLAWSIYFVGYAALVSVAGDGGNHRYYWPLLLVSTMAGALLWPRIWAYLRQESFARLRSAAAVLIALIIPAAAVLQLCFNVPVPFSSRPSQLGVGIYFKEPTLPPERVFAEMLLADDAIEPHDKLASNEFRWARLVTFYARAQIFGRDRKNDISDPAFQAVLRAKDIDHYLYFSRTSEAPLDVSGVGVVSHQYILDQRCPTDYTSIEKTCRVQIVDITY